MIEEDKSVDVIETCIIFAVNILVNVKVRKTVLYGDSEPEYKLVKIGRVIIPDELDWETNDSIVKDISKEVFDKVKEYEIEIKGENKIK